MYQQTRPLCKCRNSFFISRTLHPFYQRFKLISAMDPSTKAAKKSGSQKSCAPVPPSLRFPVACCQVVPKTAVVAASSKTRGFFYIKVGWLELRKLVEWNRSFFSVFFFHRTLTLAFPALFFFMIERPVKKQKWEVHTFSTLYN